MPFTLSHALAVLPLARGRRLVPGALVIGSWVPDLPYFVPGLPVSGWTHAPDGPVTIDLLLGALVFAVWELLLRRPLGDLAPGWLRERVPPAAPASPARAAWALVSVVLGAATHVGWDAFTHPGRWGTDHIARLAAPAGPLPLYKWLQFGSGVLGLAGLVLWLLLWVRRTPRRYRASRLRARSRYAVWWAVAVVFGLTVALVATLGLARDARFEAVAFATATTSMAVTAATTVLACVGWHLVTGRRAG